MCILFENGEKIEQKYGTLTFDLEKLRQELLLYEVSKVAMESTSIYWLPLWRLLENDFEVKLVNPYFIRQLPGRKSDVKDAHWIALALQKELIRSSYVPDQTIRQLRGYNRRMFYLNRNLRRAEQSIDLILQRSNIRLSNYVSDIGGKSYRKVVEAIIGGESDSEKLLCLVHGRTRKKHTDKIIQKALQGIVDEVDRELLRQSLDEIYLYERQLRECHEKMKEIADRYFKEEVELLCSIPGVKELSAMSILAEIGVDMRVFLSASSLVGWAGLRPRNDESAGKFKSRKTLHGNKYLRVMLTQCAWAATRTKNSRFYLKYNLLKKRMNHKKSTDGKCPENTGDYFLHIIKQASISHFQQCQSGKLR